MDKDTRNSIQHATQDARKLLEAEFAAQLEGTFDIRPDGTVAAEPGRHFAEDPDALRVRAKLVEAVAHQRALGEKPADAVKSVLRAAAFTTLNRFVALKMLEARKIVQECVSKGLESSGFKNEFLGLADGLKVQLDAAYRLYLECVFDEIGREVRVLFDRRDPASLLWPRRTALDGLLGIVNQPDLAAVWGEDETIGWVYQYFNGEDERRQMRAESQAPRNSRELAVRNQFFTPRYVVEFLTDNTLGRTWVEMQRGETRLMEQCRYLVRRPSEVFLRKGEEAPGEDESVPVEQRTVYVPFRAKKDPRELRVLDPACGSGHFLLYSFDLLVAIYEEAWVDGELGPALWKAAGFQPQCEAPAEERPVNPASVRWNPGTPAQCFRCGWSGPVADARFVLGRYNPHSVAGRPMVYCAACAAEMAAALSVDMPLQDFDLGQALRQGWFAHTTANLFVSPGGPFAFEYGGQWIQAFEQIVAAAQPAAMAKLHHVLPGWILRHNLHGVDIDPRAAQIAALALWMRAQRAWNDFGVRRADRPLVTRTNVVVAEPMPGEADLRKEFTASLEPAALGQLVGRMFEAMELAGEAGTLLRIEDTLREAVKEARAAWESRPRVQALFPELERRKAEQLGMFDVGALPDAGFWDDAEAKVLGALRKYAEGVQGGAGYRRRLFAEDAARGFAFIDVCGKRYDVVLMNPPFGAGSLLSKPYLERAYPDSKTDLYATFVERGLRLAEDGCVGVLSNRTGFFLATLEGWRRTSILASNAIEIFLDLGDGVLDGALVEAAAYVLRPTESRRPADCIRLLDEADKAAAALVATRDARSRARFAIAHDVVRSLPSARLSYWAPPGIRTVFARLVGAADQQLQVKFGMSSKDDFRFLRLAWEISPARVVARREHAAPTRPWMAIAKGGEYSPYTAEVHLVARWSEEGKEIGARATQLYPYLNGNAGWVLHNEVPYGSPGVTYSKRTTSAFCPRILPSGCLISDLGCTVYAPLDDALPNVQAVYFSKIFQYLLELNVASADAVHSGSAARHYEIGTVAEVPIPPLSALPASVGRRVVANWRRREAIEARDETQNRFVLWPELRGASTLAGVARAARANQLTANVEILSAFYAIEAEVQAAYGLTPSDADEVQREFGPNPLEYPECPSLDGLRSTTGSTEDLIRALAERDGHARYISKKTFVSDRDFELKCHLLRGSPQSVATLLAEQAISSVDLELTTSSTLSIATSIAFGRFDIRLATGERPLPPEPDPFDPLPACSPGMLTDPASGLPVTAPPPGYPIPFPIDGILVDDPGHDRDLLARIHQVFTVLFASDADDRLAEAVSILDPSAQTLRPWLRRTFFEEHIQRYSKSRRKAPIYWRLGTPSGSYSVWIYIHRFNKDTLHRVLNDHVAPKLRYESSKLATLQSEAGPSPAPSQRKALADQETLVDELQALRAELERVAPLWDPDLDDGVVINASFLHRLFAHTRAWQKECESHWQKLQKGEYDWAHLAMRLWPERVVPKCADDRSLAIAHGLEDVLWQEGPDGKWRPLPVTDAEIAALVQERTRPAVKDALRKMGEMPEPAPARKARAAAPVGEPKSPKKPKAVKEAAAVQLGLGLPDDATPADLNAVRAALHGAEDGLAKADLLGGCGLDESAAAAALAALVQSGEVVKIGAGRGTRYRLGGEG